MKIFRITSEFSFHFNLGYTGNRFFSYPQFGHTSKVEAQSALCDFTNGYQFTKSMDFAPLPFYHTSLDGKRAGNEIYPRSTGLVPSYKGHVPGMQHRYEQFWGLFKNDVKRWFYAKCGRHKRASPHNYFQLCDITAQ